MSSDKRSGVHVLEFGCEHPLKFYEHCSACARFDDGCADLAMGEEILRGEKRLVYNGNEGPAEGVIFAGSFKCTAPLKYTEATRQACGHEGKCREEGLLIALLSGRRGLEYGQRTITRLRRKAPAEDQAAVRTRARGALQ